MYDANSLSHKSIADLVKIVNDYEQLKTFIDEQEETIAAQKTKIAVLEANEADLNAIVDDLNEKLMSSENKVKKLEVKFEGFVD